MRLVSFCLLLLAGTVAAFPALAAPAKKQGDASQDQMAVALIFAHCWVPEYDEPTVKLYLLMNKDSSVTYINVLDSEKKRYLTDGVYRKSADSAISAVKQCSLLKNLQSYPFDMWEEMELTFDPKIIGKHHVATDDEKSSISKIMATCWNTVADPYPIKIALRMEADGNIHSIHVQDNEKDLYRTIPAYRLAADDTVEAFKGCSALQGLTQFPYEIWKELDIAFTPPSAEYYNVHTTIIPQTDH